MQIGFLIGIYMLLCVKYGRNRTATGPLGVIPWNSQLNNIVINLHLSRSIVDEPACWYGAEVFLRLCDYFHHFKFIYRNNSWKMKCKYANSPAVCFLIDFHSKIANCTLRQRPMFAMQSHGHKKSERCICRIKSKRNFNGLSRECFHAASYHRRNDVWFDGKDLHAVQLRIEPNGYGPNMGFAGYLGT